MESQVSGQVARQGSFLPMAATNHFRQFLHIQSPSQCSLRS